MFTVPPPSIISPLPEITNPVAWNASPSQYMISGGADSVILRSIVLSVIIEPPPVKPSPATTFT